MQSFHIEQTKKPYHHEHNTNKLKTLTTCSGGIFHALTTTDKLSSQWLLPKEQKKTKTKYFSKSKIEHFSLNTSCDRNTHDLLKKAMYILTLFTNHNWKKWLFTYYINQIQEPYASPTLIISTELNATQFWSCINWGNNKYTLIQQFNRARNT